MRETMLRYLLAALALFVIGATSSQARNLAFIIGIGGYKSVPSLQSPVRDANSVNAQLQLLGYETVEIVDGNATRINIVLQWAKFVSSLEKGDNVLIYYSGHGVEVNGTNYIVPIDVPKVADIPSAIALPGILISLPGMIDDLSKMATTANIWIIDACRDNPFSSDATKSLGSSGGLAYAPTPSGTFVFYAAGYGQTALDRLSSDPPDAATNSLYTREMLNFLKNNGDVPINEIAVRIRKMVLKLASDNNPAHIQNPAYYDGLIDIWCFIRCNQKWLEQATISTSVKTKSLSPADEVTVSEEFALSRGNAIFLGKKSVISECRDGSSNAPFGCSVLRGIAENKNDEYTNVKLVASAAVNVRKSIPVPSGIPAGGTKYSCIVRSLNKSDSVVLRSIVALNYAQDTFYWGVIDGNADNCPS